MNNVSTIQEYAENVRVFPTVKRLCPIVDQQLQNRLCLSGPVYHHICTEQVLSTSGR